MKNFQGPREKQRARSPDELTFHIDLQDRRAPRHHPTARQEDHHPPPVVVRVPADFSRSRFRMTPAQSPQRGRTHPSATPPD